MIRSLAMISEIKRRVRKLKHAELKIRNIDNTKTDLVWDRFFDLREPGTGKAKYDLSALAALSHEEYKKIVDEYFALVYFEFYRANGITPVQTYDPDMLSLLNLPFYAGSSDIRIRFRELVKEYHPDNGGDPLKFIELMKIYEKLLSRQ